MGDNIYVTNLEKKDGGSRLVGRSINPFKILNRKIASSASSLVANGRSLYFVMIEDIK